MLCLAALLVACACLGAASILRGPKLTGSQIDASAAAAAPGQQLRLVVNQAIAAVRARDITVTPAVPFTVQSQGSVIAITFRRALDYHASYRVTVAGVTSPRGGVASTIHAQIHTPAFGFDYLVRGRETDRIVHATVGSPTRTLVYESPGIQYFVPLDGALIVVRDDGDRGSRIDIVQLHGDNVETLALPAAGSVGLITVVGTDILYTLTSTDSDPAAGYDRVLFKVDLQAQHSSVPVVGLDGKALAVDAWQPIPGANAVMLHGLDGAVMRFDPTSTSPPVPLEYVPGMGGLSPDQTRIGTIDPNGSNSFDMTGGTSTPIRPAAVDGSVPYADLPIPLDADHAYLRIATVNQGVFSQQIVLNASSAGTTTTTKLYQPFGAAPQIENDRLTSNGRYLVVEFDPNQLVPVPDNSLINRRPVDVTTDVVDTRTGTVVLELAGFGARW